MKTLLSFLLLLSFSVSASDFSSKKEQKAYQIKLQFDEQSYELKLQKETALQTALGIIKPVLKNKSNMSCVEFAYQGTYTSREEAIKMCSGRVDMRCVQFAYKGTYTSREEAINMCRGYYTFACIEFAYKGTYTSREEAINMCKGRVDMECVKFAYQGTYTSRQEAIEQCRQTRPPRGGNRCE